MELSRLTTQYFYLMYYYEVCTLIYYKLIIY